MCCFGLTGDKDLLYKILCLCNNYPMELSNIPWRERETGKVDSNWNHSSRVLVCEPQTLLVQKYFSINTHLLKKDFITICFKT